MVVRNEQKKVAVIVGATSKWQPDGRNTRMRHGRTLEPTEGPAETRWGIGGALAQKFAREGFLVVLTTRTETNALDLKATIEDHGGSALIVELDLRSKASIQGAFAQIRELAGEPEIVIY